MKYFTGAEQEALDRQLSLIGEWDYAYGRKGFGIRAALATMGLAELNAIDPQTLSHDQRTTAAIIWWTLQDQLASAQFPLHRYIFDQFNGLHLDMVNHFSQSIAIHTPRDVENYLAALKQVAPRLDEGIEEAQAAASDGIVPPRVILQRAIDQIDGLLKSTPRDNPFVSSLAARIGSMNPAMATADREKAPASAEGTVSASLIPAYRRVREMLVEQLGNSTDDVGVWRLQNGDKYYARQLATYTTTNLTADEIHDIGLKEVERLEKEMDTFLKQLWYAEGTVNERFVLAQKAVQPPATPDPRPGILAQYEGWVRDGEKRSAQLFDLRPKAPVHVLREPAFSEKTAAAHYNDPAPDGSRPGVFYLPLPGPEYEILRGRSLSYHEAVPGHHFQIAPIAGDHYFAALSPPRHLRRQHGIHRGLGTLCRTAGGRERLVPRRSKRAPRLFAKHDVPRPPSCCRYRQSMQGIGHGSRRLTTASIDRDRALYCLPGTSMCIHDWSTKDRGTARESACGDGIKVLDPRVSQCGAPLRERTAQCA